ncbi:MAG: hypothetical protein ACOY3D_03865 [Candidatus Omnitrophota bacterium]
MADLRQKKELDKQGQTASELAIFGAILVFVIGALVSYSLLFNYSQKLQMMAFRQALKESHAIDGMSASLIIPLSRRTASVVVIEDRLMPELSSAFGIGTRSAAVGSATVSYNRHLYSQPTYGDSADLPRVDFFINGQLFSFTTAGYKAFDCNAFISNRCPDGGATPRIKVFKGSYEYSYGTCPSPSEQQRGTCQYRWKWFTPPDMCIAKPPTCEPVNSEMDIDCDTKEELIFHCASECEPDGEFTSYFCNELHALDFQEGEIDLTINDRDRYNESGNYNYLNQGLLSEGSSRSEVSGRLKKSEDTRQITTVVTTPKATDIITRIIQLNPNYPGSWEGVSGQADITCATTAGDAVSCCESGDNINSTCFDTTTKRFYVRSNLKTDKPPQVWTVNK